MRYSVEGRESHLKLLQGHRSVLVQIGCVGDLRPQGRHDLGVPVIAGGVPGVDRQQTAE